MALDDQESNRYREIGANVRAEIARRDLTQRMFADAIGIDQQGLSRRLAGKRRFSIGELERAATVLRVEIGVLLAKYAGPTPRV